jgi:diaminopimelate epimerase
VRPSGEIDLVVWERGSGITMACGTGACATVVAASLEERLPAGRERLVHLPGGSLSIMVDKDYSSVRMRGPAHVAFEGAINTRQLPRSGELES